MSKFLIICIGFAILVALVSLVVLVGEAKAEKKTKRYIYKYIYKKDYDKW